MIAFDGRSNYHTHTAYCDGKDTPEELVREAIRLGCPELGFSGHSYTFFDESYCMSREGTERYCACVRELQKKYAAQIVLRLGVEQDFESTESTEGYDYVIGSVHYVKKDGVFFPVDESRECQLAAVEQYYGGDFYAFAEDYFHSVSEVYRRTKCDIVGHFDLISKFNERRDLFDPEHPRYRASAMAALEELVSAPVVFEINSGAIARGIKTEPYPENWMSAYLRAHGCRMIFSSDCHDKAKLLFGVYQTFSEP